MERRREMAQLPPAKRMKLDGPVRVAGDEAATALMSRRRSLRQTLLVVLFMARVTVRTNSPASISQISSMLQRNLERAFRECHEIFSRKIDALQARVESKFETFNEQFKCPRHEMGQLANKNGSNRHADQHNREESAQEHVTTNRSNSNIRLCFLNSLKPPVYTDRDITDENNAAIKVAVFEGDRKITTGPPSKAQIEILVLHGAFYNKCRGNWTKEEFDKHIVQGRDEQPQVLGTVWLNNGEAELNQIRFREGTCRKKIVLAARVCQTENIAGRILEAITKPVEVKDRRNEPNEKRYPPRLDDKVYRLEEIAKNGAYQKRLQEAQISTVRGFLKALNKDPNWLREILRMETKHSSWSKLIEHARTCVFGDRQELKRSEHGDVILYFNCVHDLVGAGFPCGYVARKEFNTVQKASVNMWKEHAYSNLEDIPSNYVMEGNAPVQISLATDVAAGPSVPPVGLSQPTSSDSPFAAYQVFVDVENADLGHMITDPNLNALDYQGDFVSKLQFVEDFQQQEFETVGFYSQEQQGHGATQLGPQQAVPSVELEWNHPEGLMCSPYPYEEQINMIQGPSGTSTSAQLNLEPLYHLPQLNPMVPAAQAAQTTVGAGAQQSHADYEQGYNNYC